MDDIGYRIIVHKVIPRTKRLVGQHIPPKFKAPGFGIGHKVLRRWGVGRRLTPTPAWVGVFDFGNKTFKMLFGLHFKFFTASAAILHS